MLSSIAKLIENYESGMITKDTLCHLLTKSFSFEQIISALPEGLLEEFTCWHKKYGDSNSCIIIEPCRNSCRPDRDRA
jgi:hypothetical protein